MKVYYPLTETVEYDVTYKEMKLEEFAKKVLFLVNLSSSGYGIEKVKTTQGENRILFTVIPSEMPTHVKDSMYKELFEEEKILAFSQDSNVAVVIDEMAGNELIQETLKDTKYQGKEKCLYEKVKEEDLVVNVITM